MALTKDSNGNSAGTAAISKLAQIDSLPCTEKKPTLSNGYGNGSSNKRRFNVSGHIVGPFQSMNIPPIVFRNKRVEYRRKGDSVQSYVAYNSFCYPNVFFIFRWYTFYMSTIALSCTGEGFGHAARVVAIAQTLHSSHRFVIFCPKHLFPFMRENLGEVPLVEIPYFSFAKHRDRIDYARTIRNNLPATVPFPVEVKRIARYLETYDVKAVISDYDPYTGFAADRRRIPVLQINHPGVVMRGPVVSPSAILAKAISLILMGKFHRKLLVSFYNGDIGPVVRKRIENHPRKNEDFFVMYLKPGYRKIMNHALHRLGIGNVHIFPDPDKDIVEYLARCRGVISSAGHQFMSEALVLGKPIFVIPQKGQYEQLLNAHMLELSGRGTWAWIEELDTKLPTFLKEIEKYPKPVKNTDILYRFNNDLDRLTGKIERFISEAERQRNDQIMPAGRDSRKNFSGHPLLPAGLLR